MSKEGLRGMRELMQDMLEKEGLHDLRALMDIKDSWEELVDEKSAVRARPYRLEKGRLYLGVDSHAMAQELHYRVEDIKKQLSMSLGIEVREIVIKIVNLK